MDNMTVDDIYNLIINYYIKEYTMDFNSEFIGIVHHKPRMLSIIGDLSVYCLGWDDDLENKPSGNWQHDIEIKKRGTGVIIYS